MKVFVVLMMLANATSDPTVRKDYRFSFNILVIKKTSSSLMFRIGLTNGYEDGITGVHLKNKKQQDRTMKQFMAGDIGPGEMGCGIELMVKIHININNFSFSNPLLLFIQFRALKT